MIRMGSLSGGVLCLTCDQEGNGMHEHAGDDQYVLASLSASARCDEGRGVPAALHVGLLLHRVRILLFRQAAVRSIFAPPDLFYN